MIIAIDAAEKHSGIVTFEGGEPVSHAQLVADRYEDMADQLCQIIGNGVKGDGRVIAMEDTWQGPNALVTKHLNNLQGGVAAYCRWNGIPLLIISVKEIDSLCGLVYDKGERKHATRGFAEIVYQAALTEDQCDAVCVGHAASVKVRREQMIQESEGC